MTKPLILVRASWGMIPSTGGKFMYNFDKYTCMKHFLSKTKECGYNAIEIPLVFALDFGKNDLISMLNDYELGITFQIFTDGPNAPGHESWNGIFTGHPTPEFTPESAILTFKKQVEGCLEFNPIKINSHSLRDFFTFKEADIFFNDVLKFQEQINSDNEYSNIAIMHETHRKRFFHSPWVCRDYIINTNNFGNELKIVADYSHFTCVAETDPSDPHLNNVIDKLSSRVYHIHGRVGYDHGPQVSDPRAPEWESYLIGFELWWDNIISKMMNNNDPKCSITFMPEHGPPNYQICIPYTQQPLCDIWDINSFIGDRMKSRFNQKYSLKSL